MPSNELVDNSKQGTPYPPEGGFVLCSQGKFH